MENQFKGTKGKWKVKHSESKPTFNVIGSVLGGKHKIARCPYELIEGTQDYMIEFNKREKEESEANANLIAAAPELLEACIQALELSDKRFVDEGNTGRTDDCQNVYDTVRSAIAKALGKEAAHV